MSKICIIGKHGLIGSALAKAYNNDVSSFPISETKILYHFGSPVHPPFEENPDYHMNEILQSFLHLLPYCRDHGIYFVYPSSALVYEKDTVFTRTKKIMELMAASYPKTLGLRIFPVYGPGEHRTVISQWCEAMKNGKRPVVYGDGKQMRDFIYIDDVVEQILTMVDLETTGVEDVGVGMPVSFNTIVNYINLVLKTDLKPIYKKAPAGYSKGIVCKYQMVHTPILHGIEKILGQ